MTTKELLACTTPEAIQYIKKNIKSKNKEEYYKLKKLVDEQQFEARNFEDTVLDILNFDWQSLERDRNWWWQLQALPFLNWFSNSLELQSEEERSRYFTYCLDAIQCWANNAKHNEESPLAWHDHASAFRVRNLTNWLLFCHVAGLTISEEARAEPFASLVIEHLEWLQEDKHYSKHTNHGFDQAMIALTVGLMFARDDFEPYRQRNRERLKDEVTFAFTEEGVHKENSPGYQKMMLGRLKQLRTFIHLGEKDISELGERYIKTAEAFLRAITLPDGYLPMIGDTQGGEAGLPDNCGGEESLRIFNYSDSGYVIIKGKNKNIGDFFLLVKNCHFSNYHRHDDDLMVYLWCNGDVILGDGGLYSHNEKSTIRKFMRSHLAHTVAYVKGKPVRDKWKLKSFPKIGLDENCNIIYADSFMFGDKISRKVDVSSIEKGVFTVKDESSGEPLFLNFYFGECAEVKSIRKNHLKVDFAFSYCHIGSTARFYGFFQGKSNKTFEASYSSSKYNVANGNPRIVLSSLSSCVESSIEFGFVGQNHE
ncbi:heparinase II/III family protein [Halomonas sp. TRM85114]|uniref:heparinase II/III domain-containing protein n=1 Tax=Halomonas jincaotanensis TaxID=2810616 RepID=UPI001BD45707|nr:heparinase II/III family protein [Halomonas jincaotanensis]MBS9402916.1 heparinase II/III family protein [Halomonas jincaotanensis]